MHVFSFAEFLDSDNRAILSAYMILIIYIATTVALIFAVATLIFIFLYTRVSRLKTREGNLSSHNNIILIIMIL